MLRRNATALHVALMAVDGAAAVSLFIVLSLFRFGLDWPSAWVAAGVDARIATLTYGAALVASLWLQGLYRLRARWSWRREAIDIGISVLLLAFAVFIVLFLFRLPDVSRLFLLLLFPAQLVLTLGTRLLLRAAVLHARSRGYNTRYMLVVGANAGAESFARLIAAHRELGLIVVGHLVAPADRSSGTPRVSRPILGDIDAIESILHGQVIDEIAVCLTPGDVTYLEPLARLCEDEGKVVRIPQTLPGMFLPGGRSEEFLGMPILSLVYGPDRTLSLLGKRVLDVVLSGAGLLVISPVLLGIALVVRRRDGSPVLFRQTRIGLHGRPFQVIKFRTMVPDAEAQLEALEAYNEILGHAFKVTDDPRLTRTGRWLRRTSLDELPQLWNVIRGEMSLVGPRPPLPREVADYDVWHRRRLSMAPGITGLWQVSARREADFDRWVRLDLNYIDRWSLWLDLKILARTLPAVLGGSGR